jgi:uncharacterized spore protein YtfJ
MTNEPETMARAAAAMPAGRGNGGLTALAERIGVHLGASQVFGTPVEREGVTVVPVSRIGFGFGGGSGSDPSKQQSGEGGGGAGTSACIGYIELTDGRSRFVPVVHPARMMAMVCATTLIALSLMPPRIARRRRGRRPRLRR